MSITTPFTELEAVNEMLMAIGQAPVNALVGIGDVNIALSELRKVVRYVQLHGFAFNTDAGYPLTPDINGYLLVPAGVLKIGPEDRNLRLVQRRHPSGQLAMWDTAVHTWAFSAPVYFRVTWGFGFEDLPETARNYIAISAARRFQKRILGSNELDGFNAEDEQRAWALLIRDEMASSDKNLFRQNPAMRRYTNRSGRSGRTFP
ncbi:hypothetical protein DMC25_06400 [Caulobacter sp. D4A]|uniref:hypothetical protein n=1 Tax=unclassified Caulobacter TaxID=2648921 RepID=UPI000D72DF52|nr:MULTISPECIES: hypothetical protein [unclassified Caulobacter]PXA91180.1 hypothetical protein DMC25_06400 [Caulobacter sp. D4A]PXA96799.1 hypothetical protein DMC18_00620 [Caulobacter sp. D5]